MNNYLDGNFNLIDSINNYYDYFKDKNPNLIFTITKSQEHKSDLVSSIFYGDESYWWIILLTNNLVSNDDLVEGLTIKLYSINDINNFLNYILVQENQNVISN